LADSLARLGSVRCHDCREVGAPLISAPAARPAGVRELAHREADGIAVTLVWDPVGDRVSVLVSDARTGDRFEFAVPSDRALDAFNHPFAYAPDLDAPHPTRTPAYAH
ncbi:MAG: hypothetical protein ACXWZP_07365, partial [Gaiellaceae bacterium]